MKKIDMEILDSDVLIIGSGIAGLRAALEVSRKGKNPLLVSKAPLGKANNTYLAGGLFTFAPTPNDVDRHIEKTLKSGRGLSDQTLVEKFVKGAPGLIRELQEMGLKGTVHGLTLVTRQSSMLGGPGITPPLVRACLASDVRCLDGIFVTDLITRDRACCGAIGFHKRTGKILGFRSKAVILATGGAGAIYARNNNAAGMTGDGYALCMDAGTQLVDMEFVQFYPLVHAKSRQSSMIIPSVFADLGKITNRLGEDLKKKHDLHEKPIALVSRDRLSRALFDEISKDLGVDGGLLLDMRQVEDRDIPMGKKAKEILRKNFLYETKPIAISPACHYTMGGVRVDRSFSTSIEGLFAAGEVVGGIHGANRMGGNALTESLAFAVEAARSAAERADSKPLHSRFEAISLEIARRRLRPLFEKTRTPPTPLVTRNLMGRLKRILYEKVGIIRSESPLREGLEEIDEILVQLEDQGADSFRELVRILECRNAALTGRAICISALERTESRGSHYRTDYPDESDAWLKHIHVGQSSGLPQVTGVLPVDVESSG